MSIVTREDKGSELTHIEMDNNFTELADRSPIKHKIIGTGVTSKQWDMFSLTITQELLDAVIANGGDPLNIVFVDLVFYTTSMLTSQHRIALFENRGNVSFSRESAPNANELITDNLNPVLVGEIYTFYTQQLFGNFVSHFTIHDNQPSSIATITVVNALSDISEGG